MSNKNLSAFTLPAANNGIYNNAQYGLTKREFAAIEILKALTNVTAPGRLPSVTAAVLLADNLFAQLEQPKK